MQTMDYTEEVTFQSTHPVRGGTIAHKISQRNGSISIHPPREGWDLCCADCPRKDCKFQSTHPVRGGTSARRNPLGNKRFQSTHPVRGGTWRDSICQDQRYYFNPPTP